MLAGRTPFEAPAPLGLLVKHVHDTPMHITELAPEVPEPIAQLIMENLAKAPEARAPNGRVVDPVARFHLGNGARLERINWMGDLSRKGLKESGGVMVNYLYDLDEIEKNHEAFANQGEVIASGAVRRMLKGERAIFGITPPSFAQG